MTASRFRAQARILEKIHIHIPVRKALTYVLVLPSSMTADLFISQRVVGLHMEMSFAPLFEGAMTWREAFEFAAYNGMTLMSPYPGFTDQRTGQMLQGMGCFTASSMQAARLGAKPSGSVTEHRDAQPNIWYSRLACDDPTGGEALVRAPRQSQGTA